MRPHHALLASLLALGGCCLGRVCDECPFPIRLYVTHDASGELLGEDTVSVDAPTCDAVHWRGEILELSCELDVDHEVTLSAEGFSDETLWVFSESSDDDGCCSCGYVVAEYEVELSEIPHSEGG
jgi:hypothetical protein